MAIKSLLTVLIVITLSSVMSANYRPLFNEALVDINVIAGQTAVLPCSALHKGDHKIIWMNPRRILFSNEETIVIDDRRVGVESTKQGDWNLRIKHVQHNDSGEYTCQINTSPVKIKRVRLHVQVPAHILNELSSRDVDVPEGGDVVLTCKATGIPQPNITWFLKPIGAEQNKECPFADLNTEGESLYIQNIKRYQSGHYVCLAYNGVPPATTREMLVKVQYVPIIKLLNSRLGQSLGKETILECSVTSHPRAKISWYKNGVQINHSYKFRQEVYPGKHDTYSLTLQILYINKHDYGDYTCEAENRMGTEHATMVLYEYKEPTSRTKRTTTYIPFTTKSYDDDYYEMIDKFNQEKKTDEYVADGEKYTPQNSYSNNNNKIYAENADKSNYLRNTDYNTANQAVMNIAYIAISVLFSSICH
ncbi:limbic system-associated membrane protein-like isoform X2 [Mercenaria mercenaria]|uniref:limbic system-associated membrane protein-like isoform X2 n=1 Tax=Mercenaria mercenaria TaxID=6596 RepID=UPI00234F61A8|nr:limbic system-associated membrane protein-like isoform X2 [Mercenaria mercenaria]